MRKNKKNKIRNKNVKSNSLTMLKSASWLFLAIPILFIVYIYMTSQISGIGIGDLLISSPLTTLTLIIAMINPFCGVICKQALVDLEKGINPEQVKVNIVLLAISQLIILNLVGVVILAIALYKGFHWRKGSIKAIRSAIEAKYIATRISITLGVLLISSVCTFLAYKITII